MFAARSIAVSAARLVHVRNVRCSSLHLNLTLAKEFSKLHSCAVSTLAHNVLSILGSPGPDGLLTAGGPQSRLFSTDAVVASDDEGALESFQEMGLRPTLIKKLHEKGIKSLFPPQKAAFKPINDGKNVLLQALTGSGKTLAVALPVMNKLHAEPVVDGASPKVLVIVPTRELCLQVAREFHLLSIKGLKVDAFIGGESARSQAQALSLGCHVAVGTPGRLNDLANRGLLRLNSVNTVIMDEIDRMLDMGFKPQIASLVDQMKNVKQTIMLSATVPPWLMATIQEYLKNAPLTYLDLMPQNLNGNRIPETIKHYQITCTSPAKLLMVSQLYKKFCPKQERAIVFTQMKREVKSIAEQQLLKSICTPLHGDMSQSERNQSLEQFLSGKKKVLLATDVAARGLDIPNVELVIQFSPPPDNENYIHRAGRTGRAGRDGVSVLLCSEEERGLLAPLEKYLRFKFTKLSHYDLLTNIAEELPSTLSTIGMDYSPRHERLAATLIKQYGPERTINALVTAYMSVVQSNLQSLYLKRMGFVTLQLKDSSEQHWKQLLEALPVEISACVQGPYKSSSSTTMLFEVPRVFGPTVKALGEQKLSCPILEPATLPDPASYSRN